MIVVIDKLKKQNMICEQDGCSKLAVAEVSYKNIFKHKFYLCKDCMNKMYEKMGKFLTPKSPKNIIKKNIGEGYEN
ncbi:MAG: hypothetical protein KBT30_02865 [Clostridiales bacterium]|nr:hypothetical protein [Candidatus Apopatousia equi]